MVVVVDVDVVEVVVVVVITFVSVNVQVTVCPAATVMLLGVPLLHVALTSDHPAGIISLIEYVPGSMLLNISVPVPDDVFIENDGGNVWGDDVPPVIKMVVGIDVDVVGVAWNVCGARFLEVLMYCALDDTRFCEMNDNKRIRAKAATKNMPYFSLMYI